MSDIKKAEPAVRVAKEGPLPPPAPANTLMGQILEPVPTVNPAEPPVPSKRDQPGIPLEEDLHFRTQRIINDAHRGLNPDIAKLSAADKATLIEFLNQESENERVFRDASRELIRKKLRELLGAKDPYEKKK